MALKCFLYIKILWGGCGAGIFTDGLESFKVTQSLAEDLYC